MSNPNNCETCRHKPNGEGGIGRRGDRVKVGNSEGVLVGAGGGANFEVLFGSGDYAGRQYVCHPSTIEFRRST